MYLATYLFPYFLGGEGDAAGKTPREWEEVYSARRGEDEHQRRVDRGFAA